MSREFLTPEEAVSLLPEDDTIHTFQCTLFGLIGADWNRNDIIDRISKCSKRELAGETARSLGHGLAIYDDTAENQSEVLFVETVAAALVGLEAAKAISFDD